MQNLFRDGGPLDIAMGLLGLLLSIALLWQGMHMAQNGGSWWWPLTAGMMVVLSLHGLYRRRRAKHQSCP
ncbi:hypothetical protein ACGF4C_19640 [Streptomyces sp. NPDC048197]|uniref:hypothetical protein n=1 Tax=Streptomyces sp. NPDC048197 TaxID=3365511 RepID=UPI0037142C2B